MRLTNTGFNFYKVKSILNIRVFLNQFVYFGVQKAICYFMSQNNLSHVNILLIEGIIKLNALELIRTLFSFLDETITIFNIANFITEVLELYFSDSFVFIKQDFIGMETICQFVQLLFLVNESLI
jgi:hypothetical protein